MGYNILRSPPQPSCSPENHYSLPRGHGIPLSYTCLIDSDRYAHITLLQSVYLLATHIQAVGAIHSNGGQLPLDQAPPWDYFLWSKNPGASYTGVRGGGGGGV